ncbi:MAG: SOS response-associated peptidase [Natronomonas sp.]
MCGRYSLFTEAAELQERFGATMSFEFEPRYNAAPSQSLPVITSESPETIQRLEWGLIPEWAESDGGAHINARAETVDEKPAFQSAYESRRCLVLADGFYEWSRSGDGKRPHRVSLIDDEPFAMAGLYERWRPDTLQTGLGAFAGDGPTGEADPRETFTIITTEPNGVVEPLHHRMAVILDPDEESAWLEGRSVSLDPYPDDRMRSYPVSTAVNDPSNDSPELIEPVG